MAKRKKKKKRKNKPKKKRARRSKKRVKKSKKRKVSKRKIKKKKKTISKTLSKQTKDSDGNLVFKVPENWSTQAYVNKSKYEKKYKLSIKDNENFWKKEGKRITWIKPYTKIKDVKFTDVSYDTGSN